MKNFNIASELLATAQKQMLTYLRNSALAEIRETFNTKLIGNEIMILFRSKQFNKTELFENCVFDLSLPIGCIIPYDAENIGNIQVIYFDSLKFSKETGNLKAPVTLTSFYDLGFNTWDDKATNINPLINLLDEINQYKNDFEVIISDGDNHNPGGEYLNMIPKPLDHPVKFEASDMLLEYFFGVNSTDKSNFYTAGYKNKDAQQDNEEYEAVQREMYG